MTHLGGVLLAFEGDEDADGQLRREARLRDLENHDAPHRPVLGAALGAHLVLQALVHAARPHLRPPGASFSPKPSNLTPKQGSVADPKYLIHAARPHLRPPRARMTQLATDVDPGFSGRPYISPPRRPAPPVAAMVKESSL